MFSFRQGLKSNDIATIPDPPKQATIREVSEPTPPPQPVVLSKPLIGNGGRISVAQANKSMNMSMNKRQICGKGFKMF